MTPPLLEVTELRKHFTKGRRVTRAVDGVTFSIDRGESFGLVGESGCGKSTTARTIIGLERATSGAVRFDGVELTTLSPRRRRPFRRRIQMIFQDPYASLDPRQSAASIVGEPLAIHRIGKPRERHLRTLELFEAVGLDPRHAYRYPHEFSGGQRQRIGIARALALEPELLLCDEPVSALDVSIQAQIINLLAELRDRYSLALLFIAHDLAVVRHLCERIAVMYLGRIVESAPRATLIAHPRHPYTRALLSAVPEPDPDREATRSRILLDGDPASPDAPPPGCPFHPRCAHRTEVPDDRCRRERPELEGVSPAVACHLTGPLLSSRS